MSAAFWWNIFLAIVWVALGYNDIAIISIIFAVFFDLKHDIAKLKEEK